MFNLALLARQAWRLLQEPMTLNVRVLKAVYFPDEHFLDAGVGVAPSRIWRAIVDGKDVLKLGLIRRIGTDTSTKIWEMNWLPRDNMLRPLCSLREDPPQFVSELIDQTTLTWKRDLVQCYFTSMDCDAIFNIPLSTKRLEDFWAWHYEKKGVFSVRSTYRMLVHNKEVTKAWEEQEPGRSDTATEKKEWQDLWRVKMPSKICQFLWRLACHSIPTGDVRHRRNMAPTSNCGICGAPDLSCHSLLECNMARCAWALEHEDIVDFIYNTQHEDAQGWLVQVMDSLPHNDMIQVMVKLWAIGMLDAR